MKIGEALEAVTDAVTVKRVFGEPYERGGLTVIPAATVSGGGGGGQGHDPKGQEGEGGGFAVRGRPAGAYVIKGSQVSWRPAVDPNRVVVMAGLVIIAYLFSRPRLVRARASAHSTD